MSNQIYCCCSPPSAFLVVFIFKEERTRIHVTLSKIESCYEIDFHPNPILPEHSCGASLLPKAPQSCMKLQMALRCPHAEKALRQP